MSKRRVVRIAKQVAQRYGAVVWAVSGAMLATLGCALFGMLGAGATGMIAGGILFGLPGAWLGWRFAKALPLPIHMLGFGYLVGMLVGAPIGGLIGRLVGGAQGTIEGATWGGAILASLGAVAGYMIGIREAKGK